MAVTTIGTTGTIWGLSYQNGMLIQSQTSKDQKDMVEVRDEVGEIAAVSFYNPTQSFSFSGVIASLFTTTPGPGIAIILANTISGGQTTTGGVYSTDITYEGANQDFKKISGEAKRWNKIA